jgi:alkylhydroperoxidase family enzyme
MRVNEPRIAPVRVDDPAKLDAAQKEMLDKLGKGPLLNIMRTLLNHPELMRRWMVFANHVLSKSKLPAREREIVILRIGYLCRSGYEWGQHVVIARQSGLSDDEIRRIKEGSKAAGWSEPDRLLLAATDELHEDAFVSDATWRALAKHFNTQQLMDIVFTVGQYNLVSMALNSFGVQPEPGLPTFDV